MPPNRLLRFFRYDHLPDDLQEPSRSCARLAHILDRRVPDGPEKTAGLRKLLEAKDCMVRACLPGEEEHERVEVTPIEIPAIPCDCIVPTPTMECVDVCGACGGVI